MKTFSGYKPLWAPQGTLSFRQCFDLLNKTETVKTVDFWIQDEWILCYEMEDRGRMLWFKSNVSLPVFRPSHPQILTLSCSFLHVILQPHVQLFTYMYLLLNTCYERDVSLVLTVLIFHFCGGHMHKSMFHSENINPLSPQPLCQVAP